MLVLFVFLTKNTNWETHQQVVTRFENLLRDLRRPLKHWCYKNIL